MSEQRPPDGPIDEGEDRSPPPPKQEPDTFEREIEGELRELREELAGDGSVGDSGSAAAWNPEEAPGAPQAPTGGDETIEVDALSTGDDEERLELADRLAAAQEPFDPDGDPEPEAGSAATGPADVAPEPDVGPADSGVGGVFDFEAAPPDPPGPPESVARPADEEPLAGGIGDVSGVLGDDEEPPAGLSDAPVDSGWGHPDEFAPVPGPAGPESGDQGEPEPEIESAPEFEPEVEIESLPELELESNLPDRMAPDPEIEPGTEIGSDVGSEPGAEFEPEALIEPEAASPARAEALPDAETEPGLGAQVEPEGSRETPPEAEIDVGTEELPVGSGESTAVEGSAETAPWAHADSAHAPPTPTPTPTPADADLGPDIDAGPQSDVDADIDAGAQADLDPQGEGEGETAGVTAPAAAAAAAGGAAGGAAGTAGEAAAADTSTAGGTALDPAVADASGDGAATVYSPVGGLIPPIAEIDLELDSQRKPAAMWAKFFAGSMLIVVSIATAVSVTILLGLTDLGAGINEPLLGEVQVAEAAPGEAQTILLLGSDQREGDIGGRSDTAMLLRLDPDKDLVALFSLPRDLRANIPGVGVDRLNAAYAFGGTKLAVQTIQQITGLDINHVVTVNFFGFAKGVDAIDCVYTDVDQHYFNDNSSGGDLFSEIDVKAGYQRLCGFKALQYVRFRHTDNDIVRGARQQNFVREARPNIPTGDLVLGGLIPGLGNDEGKELIEIFKEHTSSDLKSASDLVELVNLLVDSRGSEFKQVQFEGGRDRGYVTSSDEQMELAIDKFLGEEPPAAPRTTPAERKRAAAAKEAARKEKRERERDPTSGVELVDVSDEGKRFAEIVDEAGTLNIAAYYPKRLPPGATISDDSRGYRIKAPDRSRHRSYKIVVSIPGAGITEYFGVSGTPWKEAPILEGESEIRMIEGSEYKLYFAGDRLRMVAWETDEAAYWVSNTLLNSLSEEQMIAVATSMGTFL